MIEQLQYMMKEYGEKRAKEAMKKVRAQNNFKILPQNRAPVPGYSSSEYPGNEVDQIPHISQRVFAVRGSKTPILKLILDSLRFCLTQTNLHFRYYQKNRSANKASGFH